MASADLNITMDLETLQWKEDSPGIWSRFLDPMELFYIANRTIAIRDIPETFELNHTLTATTVFEFETPDLVSAVRSAWKTLRYDHPGLGQDVVDGKFVYKSVTSEDEIIQWLSDTFVVVSDKTAADYFLVHERRLHPTCILFPQTKEVTFQTPHYFTNASGLAHLFNNLFELIISPREITFGGEAKNLIPSLFIAAEVAVPTPEIQDRVHRGLGQFISILPGIGLPTKERAVPGRSNATIFTFTKEQTKEILAASKARGFTLNQVLYAALSIAVKEITQEDGLLASMLVIDMRTRGPKPPFSTNENPLGAYHTAVGMVIVPTDFEQAAAQVKQQADAALSNPNLLSESLVSIPAISAGITSDPPGPISRAPFLSNFGSIDGYLKKQYGSLTVKDWNLAVDILVDGIGLFAWSFQGTLRIQACYNGALRTDKEARELVETMKNVIFRDLKR